MAKWFVITWIPLLLFVCGALVACGPSQDNIDAYEKYEYYSSRAWDLRLLADEYFSRAKVNETWATLENYEYHMNLYHEYMGKYEQYLEESEHCSNLAAEYYRKAFD